MAPLADTLKHVSLGKPHWLPADLVRVAQIGVISAGLVLLLFAVLLIGVALWMN